MKNQTPQDKQKLKNFFNACNEMIDGRFILSDIKITKILKSVAESVPVYDLVTTSLINFNFEHELKTARTSNKVNGGYFTMPEPEHKIIALVFCLLLEVNNKKINLQNFITENFFSPQGYNISYSNFSMVMLVPFKTAILNQLGCTEEGEFIKMENQELQKNQITMEQAMEDKKTEQVNSKTKIQFANLTVALTKLVSAIKVNKKLKIEKKEELLIVANAIADSIVQENLKLINALVIAFEYSLHGNRIIKPYYDNFIDNLIALY